MTLFFLHIACTCTLACKIINALIIAMSALLIAKFISAFATKNAIVNSKALNKHEMANLFYLLPKALLEITSTAKVKITENETTSQVVTQVLSQEFKVSPKIIGDNNFPIALEYKTNFLYNDVVSFKIGDNGLLSTVNTKMTDETATALKSITDATKEMLAPTRKDIKSAVATNIKVSIKDLTHTAIVDPNDISKPVTWNPVVGNEGSTNVSNVDLGYGIILEDSNKLHIPTGDSNNKRNLGSDLPNFEGIYSRPIETNKFTITPNDTELKNSPSSYFVGMPSLTHTLMVPLKRGHFIEKSNNLVLTNGLITSNEIKKPSELVGFISIPIDIAKAIVSIPAQLLTFTINRTTQLKNLETQKGLLATEQINNQNAQITRALDLNKEIKASQAAIAKSEKEIVEAKKAIEKAVGEIGDGT
ncbi:MAG: hypothetical protein KJN84_10715 [Bacteroidia bacterium]|nr:hypothetical protein [Bacteroidia bacterium]